MNENRTRRLETAGFTGPQAVFFLGPHASCVRSLAVLWLYFGPAYAEFSVKTPQEITMLTRRDILVAAMAIVATLAAVQLASSETRVMKSTAVDWNSMEAKPTRTGVTRKVFQAPTPTLDELECHITPPNPGEGPHAPHHHPDEEMILVKEGTVESTLNGASRQVGPGSVIFQASDEMHGLRNVGQTPATYFVVKWKTSGKPAAPAK